MEDKGWHSLSIQKERTFRKHRIFDFSGLFLLWFAGWFLPRRHRCRAAWAFPELFVSLRAQELILPYSVRPERGCQHVSCSHRKFVSLELRSGAFFWAFWIRAGHRQQTWDPWGGQGSSLWRVTAAAGIFSTHLYAERGGRKREEGY